VDCAEQLGLSREDLHEQIDQVSPTPANSTRGSRK
jgi:hypothetical protein